MEQLLVMRVVNILSPDFTALDLVGPYEVITRRPGADVLSSRAPSMPSAATAA